MTKSIVLVGRSAEQVLAAARMGKVMLRKVDRTLGDPGEWAYCEEDFAKIDPAPMILAGVSRDEKLQIAVPRQEQRLGLRGIDAHLVSSAQPEGSFLELAPGILVFSWERLFVWECGQMASLSDRIMLGMEICGTYCHEVVGDRTLPIASGLPVVTSRAQIEAFLAAAGGVYGVGKARDTCQWLIDGSNSVRESVLGVMQHLPMRLGGCGFPTPELNVEIAVPEDRRHLTMRDRFVPDVYWRPFGIDLEYESDEHHLMPTKMRRDNARLRDIQAVGIVVLPATSDTLNHFDEFDKLELQIGELMAEELGEPMRRHLVKFRQPDMRAMRRFRLYDLLPPYDVN